MANLTMGCPTPFVDQSDYPPTGGFLDGRFCGPFTAGLRNVTIAYWLNVPALVCQVLLLLSFAVLPSEKSHRHYLSVGLCVSLILLELAFIVPLGTRPNHCHDAVTPNDMHSNASCAWSGALLEAGAMAGTVWILLRSLWTHLRVCFDVKHTSVYLWLAHAIGWGLPALFLAISLPITGVSYRLGSACVPNQQNAFVTWFGWLIAFGCLAALIQFGTTTFCLWLYARHFWQSESGGSTDMSRAGLTAGGQRRPSIRLGRGLAWLRVKKVMELQWRSVLLSLLVIVETVYFGTVYVAATKAVQADEMPTKSVQVGQWAACLVLSGGKKDECLGYAKVLGLSEELVIASLFMSAVRAWLSDRSVSIADRMQLIGIFTFALMIRWSMLVGWYDLIVHPRRSWTQSDLSWTSSVRDEQA
ncbi:hypothetical protein LTR85_012026 [Meristemomyces frigidus]|nr:hypothetical protein LTR85_012026 [Meristemomyces frigidus]